MAEATRASSIATDVKGTPSTNQSINNDTHPTSSKTTLLTSVKKFLNKKDNLAEEPPNGGLTAWLQVFGCFLVFMNNWGLACSFGVYQAYYQLPTSTPNLTSHSPTSISWIGTTQASLTLLIGVASGPTLVLASLLLSLTFMLLSLSTTYYQILLTQGILQGISSGLLYIPYLTFLAASFLLFCGMMTPYILSATFSFTRISALSPASLTSLASLPASSSSRAAAVADARDTSFYTVPIINAANSLGRILPAAISDHGIGAEIMLFACSVALSVLAFCWIAVRDRAAYTAFLILWGFFSGGIAALPAAALPYICPRMELFATRLGLVYCAAGLGVLIGTPVGTAIDALFEGEGGGRFLGVRSGWG